MSLLFNMLSRLVTKTYNAVSFHHAKFIETCDVKMSLISPIGGDKRPSF